MGSTLRSITRRHSDSCRLPLTREHREQRCIWPACTPKDWVPQRTSRRQFSFTKRQQKRESFLRRSNWRVSIHAVWASQQTLKRLESGMQLRRHRKPALKTVRSCERRRLTSGSLPKARLRACRGTVNEKRRRAPEEPCLRHGVWGRHVTPKRVLNSNVGFCRGTIAKSATYKISGALQRRAGSPLT